MHLQCLKAETKSTHFSLPSARGGLLNKWFASGNTTSSREINANTVHSQSPNTKGLQLESIFSRCRFKLLGDTNSLVQPAKSNAVARGWPTVFLADVEAQVINRQPVAPLIVA